MIIYLDMDGVLADFFKKYAKDNGVIHWKQIPDHEKALSHMKNTDFFYKLEAFPSSKTLVEGVDELSAKYTVNWGICSSPLRNDRDNSAYWKRKWLEERGFMPEIKNLIFTSQKQNFATNTIDGSSNILVDDKPDNIRKWEIKGGTGLLYQASRGSVHNSIAHAEILLENIETKLKESV